MTPEERMDKMEGDLAQMREDHDISIDGLRRLAIQYFKMNQADHRAFMAQHQAHMADHQALIAQHQAFMADHQALMAQHRARMAEIEAERVARETELQAERERQKGLEGRVDGIEEMTKFLRELLEGNLRPQNKPPETEN